VPCCGRSVLSSLCPCRSRAIHDQLHFLPIRTFGAAFFSSASRRYLSTMWPGKATVELYVRGHPHHRRPRHGPGQKESLPSLLFFSMRYTPPTLFQSTHLIFPLFLLPQTRPRHLNPLPPLDNHPSNSEPATEPEATTKPTLDTIQRSDIISTLAWLGSTTSVLKPSERRC
jgi:hypothetical protein